MYFIVAVRFFHSLGIVAFDYVFCNSIFSFYFLVCSKFLLLPTFITFFFLVHLFVEVIYVTRYICFTIVGKCIFTYCNCNFTTLILDISGILFVMICKLSSTTCLGVLTLIQFLVFKCMLFMTCIFNFLYIRIFFRTYLLYLITQ